MSFEKHLRKLNIDEAIIREIMSVDYQKDKNPHQDTANFMAKAVQKCEELLDYDTISEVMFDRACCKSGSRLKNARNLAKNHGNTSTSEKLILLGKLKYMGNPFLNSHGDIETVAIGSHQQSNMRCPCWQLKGTQPVSGRMPLSYCKCCAGHFRFHYQKALGLTLRVKEVVSSILNSGGKLPCVFIFEIIKK
jgi:hypothetical protein